MAGANGGERKRGAAGAKKASSASKPAAAKPAAGAKADAPRKPVAKGRAAPAKKAGAGKAGAAAKAGAAGKVAAGKTAAAKKSAAGKVAAAKKSAAGKARSAAQPAAAAKKSAPSARKPAAGKAAAEKTSVAKATPARKRTASPAKRAVPAKASGAKKPAVDPKPTVAATEPGKEPRSERAEAVERAARSYFEAIAARDAGGAASHWHAEGINDLVPLGVFRGAEAVRGLFREMFASMPDMTMAVDRITADHEGAAVQWRLAGTFSGAPFQGIEPTGRRVELRGTDCLEIDDQGKVRRNTGYYDGAAFARAIGMLPPQDSGVERAMRTGFNAVTKLRTAVRSR